MVLESVKGLRKLVSVSNSKVETLTASTVQPLPLRKIHPCLHMYSCVRYRTAYDIL